MYAAHPCAPSPPHTHTPIAPAGSEGHLLGAQQAWCGGGRLHRPSQPEPAPGHTGPTDTRTHPHLELQGPSAPRVSVNFTVHVVEALSLKFNIWQLVMCQHW
jgi:hypothetical protein